MQIDEKIFGALGVAIGVVGLVLTFGSVLLTSYFWNNRAPYLVSDLVLTLGEIKLVGDTADVFFSTERLPTDVGRFTL